MKKSKKTDESMLIKRLKQGDGAAVTQWFKHYQPILLKLALKRVSQFENAQELVQQTFINCLKHLPLFREESSILTWMSSVLRHEIADYYRKKYAKKAIQTLPLANLVLSQPVTDASVTAEKVRRVLAKMLESRQELLLMKYVDQKKVKQIATELDRTIKSVESELFRARVEFRELYLAETE